MGVPRLTNRINSRYRPKFQAGGDASLVYQLGLTDGSLTPQTGDAPTFSRTGTRYFLDGPTEAEVGSVATTNPAFGSYGNFIDSNSTGLYMGPGTKNELVQSEAPATTWSTVGSPTSVNNSVGTWGDLTYGSIVAASSGDGITQTSGYAAASEAVILSAWVGTSSGTLEITFTVEGVGGTPESESQTFVANTVPKRVYFYKTFTASATGNVKVDITCDAAGTLFLGGMQLEGKYSVSGNYEAFHYPSPYVKTTTAAAAVPSDQLILPDGTVPLTSGSFAGWFRFDTTSQVERDTGSSAQNIIFPLFVERSDGGGKSAVQLSVALNQNPVFIKTEYNDITDTTSEPITADQLHPNSWHHLAMTWDHDGSDVTVVVYLDGAQLDTGTQTTSVPAARANGERILGFVINGAGDYSAYAGQASTANIKIHNEAKDSTFISDLYDAEKADFETQNYYYGYPASGRYEPDTVFQLDFSESSGDLTEIISGTNFSTIGTPVYTQTTSDEWTNIGPGIKYEAGERHEADSQPAAWNPGTNDFTEEFIYKYEGTSNQSYCVTHYDATTPAGLLTYQRGGISSGLLQTIMITDAGTNVQILKNSPVDSDDGNIHKIRLTCNRDGNFELFIDGQSAGTASAAAGDGEVLSLYNTRAAAQGTTTYPSQTNYEYRLSHNIYNNSGGPNGG